MSANQRIQPFLMRRQSGPDLRAFISTWRTTNTSTGSSASNQVKLPLVSVGTYDFIVNWGDGTSSHITSWNQTETTKNYLSSGDYTLTITGQCDGWAFANSGDRLKILNISQWGSIRYLSNTSINTFACYRGCTNLNFTATDNPDFSLATSLSGFFYQCTALTGNSSINNWDVTTLTALDWFFYLCSSFNQPIANWSMGNKTNINNMLRNTAYNQPLSSWDVSSVINFDGLFWSSSFNQDISGWNTANAIVCSSMFRQCPFNQPIGSWNVGNVINMQNMFNTNTAFNQPIGSWNVAKVSNFGGFMTGKSPANFSAANLDAIYNGWSPLTFVNTGLTISFGTIKYTAASTAGRAILTGAPNNWTITDGGI